MTLRFTEENLVLYPAVYNRKGLQGDFQIYVLEADGSAYPLSGRGGPYTSVQEWFKSAGKDVLGKEPSYVLLTLSRELPSKALRVERGDIGRLEELAGELERDRRGS